MLQNLVLATSFLTFSLHWSSSDKTDLRFINIAIGSFVFKKLLIRKRHFKIFKNRYTSNCSFKPFKVCFFEKLSSVPFQKISRLEKNFELITRDPKTWRGGNKHVSSTSLISIMSGNLLTSNCRTSSIGRFSGCNVSITIGDGVDRPLTIRGGRSCAFSGIPNDVDKKLYHIAALLLSPLDP